MCEIGTFDQLRFQRLGRTLLLLILLGVIATGEPATSQGDQLARGVDIGLYFPEGSGKVGMIGLSDPSAEFCVVIHNSTDSDLVFWRGLAYAGYKSLSFELKDAAGKVTHIAVPDRPMGSEPDRSVVIAPDGYFVQVVRLKDDDWVHFGQVKPGRYSLVAVYCSERPKAKPTGWTGKLVSRPSEVDFTKRK